MANIKTAISLQESLFRQVEAIARDMNVSRSRVFALALESFLHDYYDRRLFDEINQACESALPDEIEQQRMSHILRQHRRMVEGEW